MTGKVYFLFCSLLEIIEIIENWHYRKSAYNKCGFKPKIQILKIQNHKGVDDLP